MKTLTIEMPNGEESIEIKYRKRDESAVSRFRIFISKGDKKKIHAESLRVDLITDLHRIQCNLPLWGSSRKMMKELIKKYS